MNIMPLYRQLSLVLFMRVLQERYMAALFDENTQQMSEISGTLSLAFASLGNQALAKKWADEFWEKRPNGTV